MAQQNLLDTLLFRAIQQEEARKQQAMATEQQMLANSVNQITAMERQSQSDKNNAEIRKMMYDSKAANSLMLQELKHQGAINQLQMKLSAAAAEGTKDRAADKEKTETLVEGRENVAQLVADANSDNTETRVKAQKRIAEIHAGQRAEAATNKLAFDKLGRRLNLTSKRYKGLALQNKIPDFTKVPEDMREAAISAYDEGLGEATQKSLDRRVRRMSAAGKKITPYSKAEARVKTWFVRGKNSPIARGIYGKNRWLLLGSIGDVLVQRFENENWNPKVLDRILVELQSTKYRRTVSDDRRLEIIEELAGPMRVKYEQQLGISSGQEGPQKPKYQHPGQAVFPGDAATWARIADQDAYLADFPNAPKIPLEE